MKKLIIPCLLVLLISGCGKIAPQLDVNKKIYNTFSNMQGYEAVLKVNTVSNTNNNTFDTKQYYKYPDKMRSETDGVVTIMEGGRATVQNTAEMCIRDRSPAQFSGWRRAPQNVRFSLGGLKRSA